MKDIYPVQKQSLAMHCLAPSLVLTCNAASGAFAIYLFSGVIVFHSMVEATSTCVNAVTGNSSLVQKVAFPSEVLVIPPAMISIVVWLLGGIVCLAMGAIMGQLHPGWMLLTLPLVLSAQFVFTVGFGLLLANANVFIRDVGNLWRILSMAWFFVTPNFWLPNVLDDALRDHGLAALEPVFRYGNPAWPLVMCHRIALGGTDPMLGEFWPQLGVLSIWSVVVLVLGYSSFMSRKHKFSDLI